MARGKLHSARDGIGEGNGGQKGTDCIHKWASKRDESFEVEESEPNGDLSSGSRKYHLSYPGERAFRALAMGYTFQPSLTLSIKQSRLSAPYVASISADGTISREISRITRVSFLDRTFRKVDLNKSARNSESRGTGCSLLSRSLQVSLLASVIPKVDSSMMLPFVASKTSYR